MSTWIQHFAMDVTRMTRLAHWNLYTLAENYPEYMDRYSITMERLKMAIPWNASSIWNEDLIWFDRSELLCHQVLLKYERDRESCWLRLEAGWCKELTHLKRPWCWERLKAGREGDDRGWDGWMASPTQWTWVWVSFGSWWWTGKPGMLQSMGLQRVRHDSAMELNWTKLKEAWNICVKKTCAF